MSKIARIYQGTNEIQKYYQGGVLQRLFFDWKHYIGNELNIEYAKECAGRNVVISGKTYQNLFDMKNLNYNYYDTLTDDGYKNINIPELSTGYKVCKSAVNNLIKANTVYTIIIDVRKNTFNKNFGINSDYNNEGYFSKNIAIKQNFTGRMVVTATSKETLPSNSQKVFRTQITSDSLGELEFKLMLLEGDCTNTDLPNSINGIESASEREFVKSKNLFDKNAIIQGKYQNYNTETSNFEISNNANYCISGFINIEPNTKYVANKAFSGAYYDKNKNPITTTVATNGKISPDTACYMVLNFSTTNNETAIEIINNFQLEKENVITEYEPFYEYYPVTIRNYNYKCKTDGIVLPNGVKNSIDTIDGKKVHVQRVEKIIVTKQKDATKFGTTSNTTYGHKLYYISSNIYGKKGKCDNAEIGVISDKFIGITDDEWRSSKKVNCCFMNINGVVHFLVDKTEFPSQETFNDWLGKNEVTVYYPLAEPIYTYLESGLYDDITLPDETKNEISYSKGKHIHTRKIGKYIISGGSNETISIRKDLAVSECITFNVDVKSNMENAFKDYSISKIKMICDKLEISLYEFSDSVTTIKKEAICMRTSGLGFSISILRSKLETEDADGFRTWLSNNPITVYYELYSFVDTDLYYDDVTYKLSEPLRSLPNGACDTIEGNKLIQRVGEIICNGSENWTQSSLLNNIMQITIPCNHKQYQNIFISNFFNSVGSHSNEGISFGNSLNLWINTKKLITADLKGAKQWLSENPVIVYYELATPIETEITPDMILINREPITDTVGIKLPDGTCDSIENDCYVKRVGKVIIDDKNGTYWRSGTSTSTLDIYVVRNLGIQIILKNMNTNYIYQCDSEIDMSKYITVGKWLNDSTSGSVVFKVPTEEYLWSDIHNAFLENPITLYVELATPVKIPLFSMKEGLTTLKSTNNITPQIELDCLVRDDFQNMCDNEWESGDIDYETGAIDDTNSSRIRLINYIKVKPNTTYKIDITNLVLGNVIALRCYDISKTYINSGSGSIGKISKAPLYFTTPENCYYIKFIAETTDINFKIYLKEVF